jgi:hypothetical protein
MGPVLENLFSIGVRLYREEMSMDRMQSVFQNDDKA